MAKTISNAHTSLAYRLGESSTPSSTTEKAKRLDWFKEAIDIVCGEDKDYFFLENYTVNTTIANQPYYAVPTDFKRIIQLKIGDYKYEEVPFDEVYEKYEVPQSPVPILPAYLARAFYLRNNRFYPIPIPSAAPTTFTVSTLTQSGGTATATTSAAHGYSVENYVTIAGADQTEYNGSQEILTVPSTTTFTFSVDSGAGSPATGTITSVEQNIKIWYFGTPTEPTGDSSSIVVPDRYINLLVAYAEARYWSAAHKRGKAADAFAEFQTISEKLNTENFKRRFLAS